MKVESTMGCKCKSEPRSANMQRTNSQETDTTQQNTGDTHANSAAANNTPGSPNSIANPPTTPHGQGGLPHSATDPNFRGARPHSAHQHRAIGQILRIMGDGYCYSCGIALRQMGDQLSGEYEVRRALSTGDLPNSVKNS